MFSLRWDMADPDEIHNTIISGAKLQGTNMCILMLAILIASIGLNMNSTAVIIGAMLISPLMGGITAIGYGIATNDLTLSKGAAIRLGIQVVICLITSTIYFTISPITTASSELLARTTPTAWDVLIALFGGLAGDDLIVADEESVVDDHLDAIFLGDEFCPEAFPRSGGSDQSIDPNAADQPEKGIKESHHW
jgi:uncharacterized hydrophobic protein (TIGR00271 family)